MSGLNCPICGTQMVKCKPTSTDAWDSVRKAYWVCPNCGHKEYPKDNMDDFGVEG